MTIFLLIISFIIDGVLLLGIFTLSTRIKKAEELELRQQEIASEIEGMFSSYLLEIKEENQRMTEWIERKPSFHTETSNEEHIGFSVAEKLSTKEGAGDSQPAGYTPPEPEEQPSGYTPSASSEILKMRNKGYSIDDIAKQLDKGKTEVELLLKFHQKK
ncbi:DUF6115 domain-containing protein [Halobacillus salinus]|uniref:Swarming motility protein SwrB n=1 Tax=Halobacillus salinus TaxID=192814 RepID=A0A4Z0H307_9BACI|nr:hypothetical protein [Halobacillus salinus]TGB04778.1 hypothetical protein E4663_07245 [Halobacillus salinus]